MKFQISLAVTLLASFPLITLPCRVLAQAPAPRTSIAQAPQSGYINANAVNIRSGPGTDRPVLYVAPRGTRMQILGQYGSGSNSWFKVRATSGSVPRTEGWVARQYITVGSVPTANYYDRGYQDGKSDAQAGRRYDPVKGSHNLPASASREYSKGYADGYQAGRPGGGNQNSLQQYYDRGYRDGSAAARAGNQYDPVAGSRGLPADASREYTKGYAAGYKAGRP